MLIGEIVNLSLFVRLLRKRVRVHLNDRNGISLGTVVGRVVQGAENRVASATAFLLLLCCWVPLRPAAAQLSSSATWEGATGGPTSATPAEAPARRMTDVRPDAWYRFEASSSSDAAGIECSWFDRHGIVIDTETAPARDGWAVLEARAPLGARQAMLVLRGPSGTRFTDVAMSRLLRLQDFGTQVFKLRHRNGEFADGRMYVVSDRQPRLAAIDLDTGKRAFVKELKHGVGLDNLLHSSGDLYLGMSGLGRVRAGTDSVEYLGAPVSGGIRNLIEDPNGVIWGAIYPEGAVFSYDPATGDYWESDQLIEGYKYANGLAYDDGRLFVGVGAPARLLVDDLGTHTTQQILPERFWDQTHVRPPHLYGDRLLFKLDTAREGLVLDANTFEEIAHLEHVGSHSFSEPDAEGRVFFTGDDRLWTFDLATDEVSVVSSRNAFPTAVSFGWVEVDREGFPGVSLAASEPDGAWWVWNPQTDRIRRMETDMPGAPYQTHNLIIAGDGNLWGVGYIGSGGFRLDAERGYERTRIDAPQAEGMVAIRGLAHRA